jgi:DNA-binding HxlR family transcriptional regulator
MKTRAFTCGLDAVLFVLGGKWKPLILFHLAQGTHRYGELRRAVAGVSDKVLIQQLKELRADGIVDRRDHAEIPPKVEYALTAFGRNLAKALAPLCEWGTAYSADVEAIKARRTAPAAPEGGNRNMPPPPASAPKAPVVRASRTAPDILRPAHPTAAPAAPALNWAVVDRPPPPEHLQAPILANHPDRGQQFCCADGYRPMRQADGAFWLNSDQFEKLRKDGVYAVGLN